MGRLSDYDFEDNELINLFQELKRIVNFGKYAIPVVTVLPSWSAEPGETVLFRPSSGGTTQYFYAGSAWISSWSVTA